VYVCMCMRVCASEHLAALAEAEGESRQTDLLEGDDEHLRLLFWLHGLVL
jgi:hypothetical protein